VVAGQRRLEVATIAPLDSDDVHFDGTRLFVAANRLAELIEGTIDVDVGTLAIAIRREGGFPRRSSSTRGSDGAQEAMLAADDDDEPSGVPFRGRTGVGVVEWAMGGPLSRSLRRRRRWTCAAAWASWEACCKLHGMMGVGAARGGVDLSNGEVTYRRVFPERRWLRQVQLGNVVGEGAEARPMRGITLTNAPFVRGSAVRRRGLLAAAPAWLGVRSLRGGSTRGFADDNRSAR
jgi:hypothetical protein